MKRVLLGLTVALLLVVVAFPTAVIGDPALEERVGQLEAQVAHLETFHPTTTIAAMTATHAVRFQAGANGRTGRESCSIASRRPSGSEWLMTSAVLPRRASISAS